MNILSKLTLANLRENKRRTLVTILGTMLSCALILAVVGMVTSVQKMMSNFVVEETGAYHEMFESVPADKLKFLTENRHIADVYFSQPIAKTSDNAEAITTYETEPHLAYPAKYIEPLDALPTNATGNYNVFVTYDQPKNYEAYRAQILETLARETGADINYRTNKYYLIYHDLVADDGTMKTLYQLAGIIVAIIIISSVFAIRNSFSISASERLREFGMLSSVGATAKQIRRSIIFEGCVIAAFGIPLGILLGTIAVAILVYAMNVLIGDLLTTPMVVALPLWIFPAAAALGFITIFLSSLFPAIRAGRVSPIVAIRENNDITIRPTIFARIFYRDSKKSALRAAKKLKTSKLTQKLFGIGGVIAQKNLKRSRKKYRTTVVSLAVSIAVFVGLSSFMNYGLKMTGFQYSNEKIEFELYGADAGELIDAVQAKFDLPKTATYLSHQMAYEARVYAMDEKSFAEFARQNGVYEKDLSNVVLFNDRIADTINYKLTIRRFTDLLNGTNYKLKIQPDYPSECENRNEQEIEGQTITTIDVDEACVQKSGFGEREVEFKVAKIIDQSPLGQNQAYKVPSLYISENYAHIADLKFSENSYREFFAAEINDEAKLKELENFVKDYVDTKNLKDKIHYQNLRELARQQFRVYLLIAIFLYGFIAVITLIGITNIFNTITTSIALRAPEFAMLKSIGMTSREFNNMVRLESLMYSCKSLLIGLPLGLAISYWFYKTMAGAIDFGYELPWLAVVASILFVGALVSLIMRYSVKQVEKQNIIETIRSENV